MSTTTSTAAAERPTRQFGRGRVLRLVFGSLGVLAALAFVGGAGVLTWALETHRDSSGYFTTAAHHYQTSSYALSTESLDVSGATGALEDRLARLRIAATSDTAKPLFIGIARTDDAGRYLARVEHDELRDIEFDPFTIDYLRLGTGAPATPPSAWGIWRAHATGTGTQTIDWPVERGSWTAVVMNADGSPKVDVEAQLAARVSAAGWIAAVLYVLGGLSLLGGGLLLYRGIREA